MLSLASLSRPSPAVALIFVFLVTTFTFRGQISRGVNESLNSLRISDEVISERLIPETPERWRFISKSVPINHAKQRTLLLTLTNDLSSWGRMEVNYKRNWSFTDYIERVRKQGMDPEELSLGLLTSSKEALESYKNDLLRLKEPMPWSEAEIIYLPDLPLPFERWNHTRDNRYNTDAEKQWQRRRYIARFRNYLTSTTLKPRYEHMIWLDADVFELPNGMFKRFLEIGSTNPEKEEDDITPLVKAGLAADTQALPAGLVTLRSVNFDHPDYDRNAWTGYGKRPTNWELAQMTTKGRQYPGMETWAKALSQLLPGTKDDDLVKLDSVGGTALYIRAALVREGLVFPQYLVVGTEWGKAGRDGVETEGLCYIAERMGWGCYALGGDWHTVHSDL
ncbi:hypothetical protein H072_864 [Dactylellina haptotyla CBS 200.50]|uniref:Uncharacterized protein n=1 Tax=Dactylellina haptotyla (strain CBS 200.50) TaxID=1284197 RepID=S8AQF6_DACHA|nr:hypothetical protein H072_864 [Dactylellina haptotyla CBS 200.50]